MTETMIFRRSQFWCRVETAEECPTTVVITYLVSYNDSYLRVFSRN